HPGQAAYHLVEKAARLCRDPHLAAATHHLEPPQIAHRVLTFRPVPCRESPEVMTSAEDCGGLGHALKVERLEYHPAIRPGERVRIAEMHVIVIALPGGTEAGMKRRRDRGNRFDLDGRRQPGAERRHQPGGGMPPFRVKVEHLP